MKISQIALIIGLVSLGFGHRPWMECGSDQELTPDVIRELRAIHEALPNLPDRTESREDYWAPITFHIVRNNLGLGGLPEHRLETGLLDLNTYYANTGIRFYQSGPTDFIDSTAFLTGIDSYDEIIALRTFNSIPNTINIYCVETLSNGNYDLCGISTFTSNETQGIIMANSCFATSDNHSTLSHEVGHYFDLYHTHQGSVDHDGDGIMDGDGAEFVDGTECDVRGDELCDTPADPSLSEVVTYDCIYTGDYLDGHLEEYDPDTGNLMSYSQKHCRDHFSGQQEDKVVETLLYLRPELNVPPSLPHITIEDFQSFEAAGDGDGVINPGETAELEISVTNWEGWPDASDLEFTLFAQSNNITIDQGTFTAPLLASGDTLTNSENPFSITMHPDAPLGDIVFTVELSAAGLDNAPYQTSFEISFELSLYQFGWPINELTEPLVNVETAPVVMDLTDHPGLEIVFADYSGWVYMVDAAGQPLENDLFPFNTGNQVWGSPAAADVDLDGNTEIIVTSKSRHLYILDPVLSLVDLDYDAGQYLMGSPSVGNLDDDDELEIVFGGFQSQSLLFAINHDGSEVPGFPVPAEDKIQRGTALCDINGNGRDDIVCATDGNQILLVLDSGSIASGYPFTASDKFRSAPVIIQSAADTRIVSVCRNDTLYALDENGAVRFRRRIPDYENSAPGVIEYEGGIGIFAGGGNGWLYGLDLNGADLPGWPVDTGASIELSSPVFGDLNGDQIPEVIVGNIQGMLGVWQMDGSVLTPNPIPMGSEMHGTATVSDIDFDGDLEILAGTVNSLAAIDIKQSSQLESIWATHRGGVDRRGSVLTGGTGCGTIGDINCDDIIDILDIVIAVSIIMDGTEQYSSQELWAADMNADGIVDILDVVMLVDWIMT